MVQTAYHAAFTTAPGGLTQALGFLMKLHWPFLSTIAFLLASCSFSVSTEPEKALPPAKAGSEAQSMDVFNSVRPIAKRLDNQQFDEVWDESSDQMKSTVPKLAFSTLMKATRSPLGKPAPRPAPFVAFADQVDSNGPKGEYSIVEVDTNFGGKVVGERFVLVKQSGSWKLAGYIMKMSAKSG